MISAAAHWERNPSVADGLWRDAWAELLRAPEGYGDAEWKSVALHPAAVADYPRYRGELATFHLSSLDRHWGRARCRR